MPGHSSNGAPSSVHPLLEPVSMGRLRFDPDLHNADLPFAGECLLRNLDTGDVWQLDRHEHFVVGRGSKCDVTVNDAHTSTNHCSIRFASQVVAIIDLNSSAGSSLGGRPVKRAFIDSSGVLGLGTGKVEGQCQIAIRVGELSDERPTMELLRNGRTRARGPLQENVVVIGRSSSCDLTVKEPFVSRKHVRLAYFRSAFLLQDLNSSGGTRLRGQWCQSDILFPGDIIEIGKSRFLFTTENMPAEAPDEGWRLMTNEGIHPLSRPSTLLGRDKSSDICLSDWAQVSRHHARIFWHRDGHLCLVDLVSTCGTKINGHHITQARLRGNELIQIGEWRGVVLPPGA